MTGKEIILKRIKRNKPAYKHLPNNLLIQSETLSEQELVVLFIENLVQAGAIVKEFKSREKVNEYIWKKFPDAFNLLNFKIKEQRGEKIYRQKFVNEEDTEIVMLDGEFGVAENGAIWIDDAYFPHRLLPFITQQLVLVLDRKQIVENMHEAYQKLHLQEKGFGVFISGPSKTADIEQSLVYGAHGAVNTIVILF